MEHPESVLLLAPPPADRVEEKAMPGRQQHLPEGWTLDTLHEHFSQLLEEMDRRYEQRFQAQEKAVKAAIDSAEKAIIKAEDATQKRFDSVNEFRAALTDQASQFISRPEFDAAKDALQEAKAALAAMAGMRQQGESSAAKVMWGVGLAVAIALGAGAIIAELLRK